MKQEIKTRWCEALRSGKYKQATGTLKNEYGAFCCLGVLCEVFREDNPTVDEDFLYFDKGMPESVVRDWAGQKEFFLKNYGKDKPSSALTALNDNFSFTFEQIADAVETIGLIGE